MRREEVIEIADDRLTTVAVGDDVAAILRQLGEQIACCVFGRGDMSGDIDLPALHHGIDVFAQAGTATGKSGALDSTAKFASESIMKRARSHSSSTRLVNA